MPIEWVLPAVFVLLIVWGMIIRGRLTALQQAAVQAWSEVDDLLRRRHGLVPRLADAMQGRSKQDAKLKAMLTLRGRAASAETPAAMAWAEDALTASIAGIVQAIDGNPALAADPGLTRLRSEISGIEGRLLASARHFNEAAQEYNQARLGFPGAFLAYVIRFDVLEYYSTKAVAAADRKADQTAGDRDGGVSPL